MIKKRVNVQALEMFIMSLMVLFGLGAIAILYYALQYPYLIDLSLIVIEMLIILIIAVLGLAYLIIRIWERHIVPYSMVSADEKKKIDSDDKKRAEKIKN
ncbi:MAG: hypothetical protein ACLFN8_00725 [Candidatus Woesearchaeota archaeon]